MRRTMPSTSADTVSCSSPEIAISVMLELGDNANYLIRQILDAYYGTESAAHEENLEKTP